MRDLVYKNLTSGDKKRKIVVSSEIVDRQGVRSVIRRHFVCIVREIKDNSMQGPLPYVYILKKRDTKEQKEEFFCRIKGSVLAVNHGKLFIILFMHSLKINLSAMNQNSVELN